MFTRAKVTEIGQKIKVLAWMLLNVQKVFRFEATLLTDIKSNQMVLNFTLLTQILSVITTGLHF